MREVPVLANVTQHEVEQALRARDFATLREAFTELEPADVAEAIESLEPEDRAIVFRLLRRDLAADTFEHLSAAAQEDLIRAVLFKSWKYWKNGCTEVPTM